MSDIRTLIVLAMPRTGSTHVIGILNGHPHISAKYECFHPHQAQTVSPDEVKRINALGHNFPVTDNSWDKDFADFRATESRQFLDVLCGKAQESNRTRCLAFKLFNGHLSDPALEDVLNRPRTDVILLHRNVLDAAISRHKAELTQSYSNSDTTDFRPALSPRYLQQVQERSVIWYRKINRLTANFQHRLVLDFDTILKSDPDYLINTLNSFTQRTGLEGAIPHNWQSLVRKQDLARKWQDKIANPEEIERFIAAENLTLDMTTILKGHAP